MSSPYTEGNVLRLAVHPENHDPDVVPQGQLVVRVTQPIVPVTMSPVMRVSFRAKSGREVDAILKMFDRRFAPELRRRYNPSYDLTTEEAWRDYVCTGKAHRLFAWLDEKRHREEKGELLDTDSESDTSSDESGSGDDGDGTGEWKNRRKIRTAAEIHERIGKLEGINQWRARDLYLCETRAYSKLRPLQGRCVPKFLAQVCLVTATHDLSDARYSPYFEVGGVLLEYIDSFNLSSQLTTYAPKCQWRAIIQQAVDAANNINDYGVLNLDCQPRNVIVEQKTLRPVHIDFAQCSFLEDCGCAEFDERRQSLNNQGAIGSVMANKLRREAGFEPTIQYRRPGKHGVCCRTQRKPSFRFTSEHHVLPCSTE